jgi:flap endonuclease-1
VAIDAPNLLYAFYAVQLLRTGEPSEAQRRAALQAATRGLAGRVLDLRRLGARSVVVFDGAPHKLKAEVLVAREAARSVPAIGQEDYTFPRAAAKALGVPVIEARHDAEAQACAMARQGLVDIVATTDWDALAMGAPLLLRNLSANPAATEGRAWSLVRAADALRHLEADPGILRAAVVLMGCDFFDGFRGFGPAKALKLARDSRGDLDVALRLVAPDAEAAERCRAAHALLADPPHFACAPLRWSDVDHDALARAFAGVAAPKPKARQVKLDA